MNREDLKTIINQLGTLFVVLGIIEVVPALAALYYEERFEPFLYPSVFLIIFGSLVSFVIKKEKEADTKHATIVATLIYLFAALFGAIPFLHYKLLSPLDAFFEVMSGFTTTGLTMFSNVEVLPKSILFWRSFTQWVGGIGIVVLLLTVLEMPGMPAYKFYQAEAKGEKIKPRVISTIKLLWWIYLLYTLLGTFLFYIAGMTIFDALNHTMTILSTAGFSTKNASIGSFNSIKIQFVAIFIMFLGAINFYTHYKFLTGNRKDALKNAELKFLITVSLIGAFLLFLRIGDAYKSLFQSIAALTTTGVSTMSVAPLDDFSKSLLSLLMVLGANTGSTGGGIKSIRVIITLGALYWYILQTVLPERAVIRRRLNGAEISDDVIFAAEFFTVIYLIVLSLSALGLMFLGYSGINSIFEVASAMGGVGLSVGITQPGAPVAAKLILIMDMWLGKIEIIPFFVFIGALLYKKR